jgi:hypothetical protein
MIFSFALNYKVKCLKCIISAKRFSEKYNDKIKVCEVLKCLNTLCNVTNKF